MDRKGIVAVGFIASAAVLVFTVLTPLLSEPGAYLGLDGRPSVIDHQWGLPSAIYAVGDLLCHQMQGRSLMLNGSQLPFCARCFGLLIGLTAGMACCIKLDSRLSERRMLYAGLALLALLAAERLMEEFTGGIQPLRFASGVAGGFGAALVLCHALYMNQDPSES